MSFAIAAANLCGSEQAHRDKQFELTSAQAEHTAETSCLTEYYRTLTDRVSDELAGITNVISAVRKNISQLLSGQGGQSGNIESNPQYLQLNNTLEDYKAKLYAKQQELKALEDDQTKKGKLADDKYQKKKVKLETEIKALEKQIETQQKLRENGAKSFEFRIGK